MTTDLDPKNSSSEIFPVPEQSVSGTPESNDRRKVIKKLAIGTVAIAGSSVLPDKWISPLVEFGALPAHAVTSGTPEPTDTSDTNDGDSTEKGRYVGRGNGNRPTWYFSKKMKSYPKTFKVVIKGCSKITVSNNGTRYESDGVLVKQSDVSGRGMAVLGTSSCGSKSSYIKY